MTPRLGIILNQKKKNSYDQIAYMIPSKLSEDKRLRNIVSTWWEPNELTSQACQLEYAYSP